MITIHTQLIGQPQLLSDARGTWRSAIYRSPVHGPIFLQTRGLAGDQVADTKHHGSPDQAVCCHPLNHYPFWNNHFRLIDEVEQLGPGSVGENWTLTNCSEADFSVGDIFQVGQAAVQVSAPRFPCTKQDRKLNLPQFSQEVRRTRRTGFYLRVINPGQVQAGDELKLVERPYPQFTIELINEQAFGKPEGSLVHQLLALSVLNEGWKGILKTALEKQE